VLIIQISILKLNNKYKKIHKIFNINKIKMGYYLLLNQINKFKEFHLIQNNPDLNNQDKKIFYLVYLFRTWII